MPNAIASGEPNLGRRVMDWLGTVLPTRESLARSSAVHRDTVARQERVAATAPELRGCSMRIVGGECRYYDTADQYAIVSRQGKVLWFAVRNDGDYRISR